ncbi:helix-turn-helix domain-containing protein [Cutibacterium equinum]|uniref:Helix-turn-helix domain-containing protein n=1 Tax=Cutibacterium equinum TaxID=3016342 RepID=A0ABY7QY11_9ACTN|nr:helix-turn-helix domain-containing protein [Cutibacterium equinum]WCC79590.1 helix-turn-helix domain-containing protein [Cutibacterium equinum]
MSEISERARQAVDQDGRSQIEVANAIGLSPSKFSKSLSGHRQFSALEVADLAETLGVSMNWLVTGEEDAPAIAARHRYDAASREWSSDAMDADRQVLEDIALIYRQAYR